MFFHLHSKSVNKFVPLKFFYLVSVIFCTLSFYWCYDLTAWELRNFCKNIFKAGNMVEWASRWVLWLFPTVLVYCREHYFCKLLLILIQWLFWIWPQYSTYSECLFFWDEICSWNFSSFKPQTPWYFKIEWFLYLRHSTHLCELVFVSTLSHHSVKYFHRMFCFSLVISSTAVRRVYQILHLICKEERQGLSYVIWFVTTRSITVLPK